MRRHLLVVAAAMVIGVAVPAAAQSGRVQGVVRDTNGDPIKGATVTASHPEGIGRDLTATTDKNGRFALIGMRVSPGWRFIAEAPGFLPAGGVTRVRTQMGQPLVFTLSRDLGPAPDALERDVADKLTAAAALRDAGQHDAAIAAYQGLLARNGKLTSVHLMIGAIYRDKADDESDETAKQALLEKASAAYNAFLKDNTNHERARLELDATAAELRQLTK